MLNANASLSLCPLSPSSFPLPQFVLPIAGQNISTERQWPTERKRDFFPFEDEPNVGWKLTSETTDDRHRPNCVHRKSLKNRLNTEETVCLHHTHLHWSPLCPTASLPKRRKQPFVSLFRPIANCHSSPVSSCRRRLILRDFVSLTR